MRGNEAKGEAYGRSLRSDDEGHTEGEKGSDDRSRSEEYTERGIDATGLARLARRGVEWGREKPERRHTRGGLRGLQPGMLMPGWRNWSTFEDLTAWHSKCEVSANSLR